MALPYLLSTSLGGLLPRPPYYLLSSLPLPPPLLLLLPLPLARRFCRACCVGARAWPLGRPPPGGWLIIQYTMALACSYGVPFPPNGVGAPYCVPGTVGCSPVAPSLPLHLEVGGICRSPPPNLLYQAAQEGRVLLLRGCCPLPLLAGGPPPPPPAPAFRARGAHAARGVPLRISPGSGVPPPPSSARCAGGAHATIQGGPPPPLTLGCARWLRAACSGWPLLLPVRARVVHIAGWGVLPPPPAPSLDIGGQADVSGGPPRSLYAHCGHVLLGGGPPQINTTMNGRECLVLIWGQTCRTLLKDKGKPLSGDKGMRTNEHSPKTQQGRMAFV